MMRAENIRLQRGGRQILRDVSCTVRPGRVTVVLGKNGAGKSTLLHLLAGQGRADAGSVRLDGREIDSHTSAELAGRRAVLSQSVHLGFALRVREVIELGCYHRYHRLTHRERHRLVAHYLERLALTAFADRDFRTLSGGEQKRVLLAKCLLQLDADHHDGGSGRYLLLDEPTAALDLEQQYRFVDWAARLARERGLGLLAVLHDLNLAARFADEVVLLRDGAVLAAGPVAATLTPGQLKKTFDIDCLIQDHPLGPGPLITPLPYDLQHSASLARPPR